jgi:hypothetical protein
MPVLKTQVFIRQTAEVGLVLDDANANLLGIVLAGSEIPDEQG